MTDSQSLKGISLTSTSLKPIKSFLKLGNIKIHCFQEKKLRNSETNTNKTEDNLKMANVYKVPTGVRYASPQDGNCGT